MLRIESPPLRGFRKNSSKIRDAQGNGLITKKPEPNATNSLRQQKSAAGNGHENPGNLTQRYAFVFPRAGLAYVCVRDKAAGFCEDPD